MIKTQPSSISILSTSHFSSKSRQGFPATRFFIRFINSKKPLISKQIQRNPLIYESKDSLNDRFVETILTWSLASMHMNRRLFVFFLTCINDLEVFENSDFDFSRFCVFRVLRFLKASMNTQSNIRSSSKLGFFFYVFELSLTDWIKGNATSSQVQSWVFEFCSKLCFTVSICTCVFIIMYMQVEEDEYEKLKRKTKV